MAHTRASCFQKCGEAMVLEDRHGPPHPLSPRATPRANFRPVSGLASGNISGEPPSHVYLRSGVLIHLHSLTVAGAAPEFSNHPIRISLVIEAPASRFIPRTIVVGTPEAVAISALTVVFFSAICQSKSADN